MQSRAGQCKGWIWEPIDQGLEQSHIGCSVELLLSKSLSLDYKYFWQQSLGIISFSIPDPLLLSKLCFAFYGCSVVSIGENFSLRSESLDFWYIICSFPMQTDNINQLWWLFLCKICLFTKMERWWHTTRAVYLYWLRMNNICKLAAWSPLFRNPTFLLNS